MKFFKSVAQEMKLVTWPTRKKLVKDVITVIQTTILYAIFFAIVDYVLLKISTIALKGF
ncbi:preprotein translocase subunit SecE [Vagococcus jeotgali]|uniref:preprotein translocase subunit SecE n=1 Tax=Vagococcus jeotgali TaxID=3109030 RepID=UPI002DDC5A14|nr:preprotein translocase subunit SecE [Vagococcus sp. B2T-5]